ncbi:hypothetical protein F4824DRAFT_494611 [Ustulina deusta]|nr:hypothetical protein F4824DRAFT_494611 [Ustulina deusta]
MHAPSLAVLAASALSAVAQSTTTSTLYMTATHLIRIDLFGVAIFISISVAVAVLVLVLVFLIFLIVLIVLVLELFVRSQHDYVSPLPRLELDDCAQWVDRLPNRLGSCHVPYFGNDSWGFFFISIYLDNALNRRCWFACGSIRACPSRDGHWRIHYGLRATYAR